MIGHLSPAARLLGFAGLLPPAALVLMQLLRGDLIWSLLLLTYAALIFSFLGGIWWGFAVRRQDRQAALLALSVLPSLAALLPLAWTSVGVIGWPLVLLGSMIMLTLLVDRHLVRTGEAPAGWMGLRVPLSLGLGGLCIVAGAMRPDII